MELSGFLYCHDANVTFPHGIFDKVKEDYKIGENRMHANICSYDHLDVVDSAAKGYDETLNSKIPMFIEKVDLYTSSEKE